MFDSDGVLVDSHLDGHRAWSQLAAEFSFELTDEVFASLAGVRPADSLARFVQSDELDAAVARLEDLEVRLAGSTKALPGARELLESLGGEGWAIVTSASERLAQARWDGAAIPRPPIIVAADDVTLGKPDPEPYLQGARALGVDIGACVVFEDSPSGAASGLSAGATVVGVGDQPWTVKPAGRVVSLADVRISPGVGGQFTIELAPNQ